MRISHYAIIRDAPSLMMLSLLLLLVEEAIAVLGPPHHHRCWRRSWDLGSRSPATVDGILTHEVQGEREGYLTATNLVVETFTRKLVDEYASLAEYVHQSLLFSHPTCVCSIHTVRRRPAKRECRSSSERLTWASGGH
jgi:hypothetical protein